MSVLGGSNPGVLSTWFSSLGQFPHSAGVFENSLLERILDDIAFERLDQPFFLLKI
jgi:hypothetical protein